MRSETECGMRKIISNVVSALFLTVASASCLTTAFDGTIAVEFEVKNNASDYANTFKVNPNDDKDIRNNRDKIKQAKVSRLVLTILSVGAGNAARFGSGEVYARVAGQDWPAETRDNAVAVFDNAPVVEGQQFVLAVSDEQNARLSKLIFPSEALSEIDVKVNGRTDGAPLNFRARLSFDLKVSVDLIK